MTEKKGMVPIADLGPTGRSVADNVRRLREERNLTYAAFSKEIAVSAQRNVPPLALRRIEAYARRVDVDDLLALSVALGVTPLDLLFDSTRSPTGIDADVTNAEVIAWARKEAGLHRESRSHYWQQRANKLVADLQQTMRLAETENVPAELRAWARDSAVQMSKELGVIEARIKELGGR